MGIFNGELSEVIIELWWDYNKKNMQPPSLPLSDENIVGGCKNFDKIESMAWAESSAVLNFRGAVYANLENASIMTNTYLYPWFCLEYLR